MDNSSTLFDRSVSTTVDGSARKVTPQSPALTRPSSFLENTHHVVQLVVNRDEKGYGMKVSGDYPVYVQSVKEGGAAEKAGLQAGDKIIKVNGVNVVNSTHTDVVGLIRSSSQVALTVQQRINELPHTGSLSSHARPTGAHGPSTQITHPQPVDNEKQHQLQLQREQYYRLMIEQEQGHIDKLRGRLATSYDDKTFVELAQSERNLQTLHNKLQVMIQQADLELLCDHSPCSLSPDVLQNGNNSSSEPPPLPKRMNRGENSNTNIKNNIPASSVLSPYTPKHQVKVNSDIQIDNPLYYPVNTSPHKHHSSSYFSSNSDAVNSINKQMTYPLVATCATLVNNYSSSLPTHHRSKSNAESVLNISPADASCNLINSESMQELNVRLDHSSHDNWNRRDAPPGTPPPPYPSPRPDRKVYSSNLDSNEESFFDENDVDGNTAVDVSLLRDRVLSDSSLIHAATSQTAQQPIISMEDDEISDQEMEQPEEHGPFKSLSKLWENLPHLAVFTNYILSNADPNSLLFYLLTDLYKEGNAKEMRKWAFEIHSSFLVPGAPLRLRNVDENVAHEIDEVLTNEVGKEEILRKIFWKARARAKEELGRQLADFQQKRTAGLGTIYGPADATLFEVTNDKTKETKLYEMLFLDKLNPYLDELEKDNYDPKKYYTAAALTTVLTRVFGLRSSFPSIERFPTFVSKEKSFRTKFLAGRYSRKLTVQGHQFAVQQYYTVISCNNCHQVIYGIGPQGYQCNVCGINLHRQCIKLYDDTCPGPINKKDRGIGKFIRKRPHELSNDQRRKVSSNFIHAERDRRQTEEKDSSLELNESGESKPSHPVSRSGSDRRPDGVREESEVKHHDNLADSFPGQETGPDKSEDSLHAHLNSSLNLPGSNKKRSSGNINRSESVKEQSEKRKQRRNISDPSQNTSSGNTDIDHGGFPTTTDSGSSSNSNSSLSFNGRLSESPSNANDSLRVLLPDGDTDVDTDTDVNWQDLVSPEELSNLEPHEKKRQDVINELFSTEKSHLRSLTVLYKIFFKPLQKSQILKPEELHLLFPNIKELFDLHRQFSSEMMLKRRTDTIVTKLGDMLLGMFGGSRGESFKDTTAKFCERQHQALDFIKERRKRDPRFESILVEAEKKRQCRRLQLQAILPVEMQRLSKYPLLLERLVGSIQVEAGKEEKEEITKLRKAQQLSKDIVNYVNEAAKHASNQARLAEIQRHLDQSNFERSNDPISQEFRPLDLTNYHLVLEGVMLLRRPNKAVVPVHVLLMEEVVVILHKEGDKYLLKNFHSGAPGQMNPLSPIIKISTLLVRINAVCKDALFLVNTSTNNSQMYDLRAEDDAKRDQWFKHFSDVTDAHHKREGKTRRLEPPLDNDECEILQEFPQPLDFSERAEEVSHQEESDGELSYRDSGVEINEDQETDRDKNCSETNTPDGLELQGRVTDEEWPLIQPSQVHVVLPPVHTAESRLTPLEKIKRKDEEVRRALEDKEGLVADLLNIPRQHFHDIADIVGEDEASTDPINLIMASIFQTDRLHTIINGTLAVKSDADVVIATGGKYPACASQTVANSDYVPLLPLAEVQDVASRLTKHLTDLLGKVKQIDEQNLSLRSELHKMNEKLHEQLSLHDTSVNAGTLDNLEEVELEVES